MFEWWEREECNWVSVFLYSQRKHCCIHVHPHWVHYKYFHKKRNYNTISTTLTQVTRKDGKNTKCSETCYPTGTSVDFEVGCDGLGEGIYVDIVYFQLYIFFLCKSLQLLVVLTLVLWKRCVLACSCVVCVVSLTSFYNPPTTVETWAKSSDFKFILNIPTCKYVKVQIC